jgi:Uma2 family endonuclease
VSIPAQAAVSEAEFMALPETNQPIELIDGEVIVSPSPSFWHQEIVSRMVTALRTWASTTRASVTIAQAPLDVRFATGRILQPDAMVFLVPLPADSETPLDKIPELCVEVLSQNRAYDRVTKRYLYAEAGVQEYWIVDPAGLIERRSGAGLMRVDLERTRLTSALLPGFELDLTGLFHR